MSFMVRGQFSYKNQLLWRGNEDFPEGIGDGFPYRGARGFPLQRAVVRFPQIYISIPLLARTTFNARLFGKTFFSNAIACPTWSGSYAYVKIMTKTLQELRKLPVTSYLVKFKSQ